MKISVGTNWDNNLIDAISEIPGVYEIYGSSNATHVGNGRPSFILGNIEKEDMPSYIKKYMIRD